MSESCRPLGAQAILPQPAVTKRYKDLAPDAGRGSAFLAALHHRLIDRISWDWARGWLHAHSRLELSERHGWPLLLVLLEAEPPGVVSAELLQRHIRLAAAVRGDGPLADLAGSIEVVQGAGR